jgi:predicted nucleic acid-binding OB-fold protein
MTEEEVRLRVDEIQRLAEAGSLLEADNARFRLFLDVVREVHTRLHTFETLPGLQRIMNIVMEVE